MMKKTLVMGMIVLAVVVSGCGSGAEETPTVDWSADYVSVVSVTGEIVPATWATVSAQTGGRVAEVLVEPGYEVAEGEVIVRLDPTDAQLVVQQAEAAVETTQAQLDRVKADPRAEEIAAAEAQLEAAEAALAQAIAQRDHLKKTGPASAQAQLDAAEVEEWIARDAYQREGWRIGEVSLLQYQAAEAARAAAEAQLAEVEGNGSQVRAANAAVWAATAQRDAAQAQLDLLQAGAMAEDVAVAEAAVVEAEAALEVAQVALDRCEIRAPFAGTVGVVHVRAGELVAPSQPLAILGDLATLRVETTDLDELDVARVAVGQEVAINFDAIPEQVFAGHVVRISPMADPGAGGVNYTVVVELDEVAPQVRWGMTAFVDIELEE